MQLIKQSVYNNTDKPKRPALTRAEFLNRFRWLIILAWTIPAVFGLSFLLYIEMFTVAQMGQVMTGPIEPTFIAVSLLLALWYFKRCVLAVADFVGAEELQQRDELAVQAVARVRGFSLHFWTGFLLYLCVAPATVIYSAELYSDFVATPEDWFRISLVALTVSIIVGLPIFFREDL